MYKAGKQDYKLGVIVGGGKYIRLVSKITSLAVLRGEMDYW